MDHGFKEVAYGLRVKRQNELLSLAVLFIAAFMWFRSHAASFLSISIAIVLSILWANLFEYVYHRWFDHGPVFGGFFKKRHSRHHEHPRSGCHINFGENPVWSLGVYGLNALPVILMDRLWLHNGVSAVVLTAFVLYVVLIEEIHWRVHLNLWVPFGVGRVHHMQHHGLGDRNFNVCFPIMDWLFGTAK